MIRIAARLDRVRYFYSREKDMKLILPVAMTGLLLGACTASGTAERNAVYGAGAGAAAGRFHNAAETAAD